MRHGFQGNFRTLRCNWGTWKDVCSLSKLWWIGLRTLIEGNFRQPDIYYSLFKIQTMLPNFCQVALTQHNHQYYCTFFILIFFFSFLLFSWFSSFFLCFVNMVLNYFWTVRYYCLGYFLQNWTVDIECLKEFDNSFASPICTLVPERYFVRNNL